MKLATVWFWLVETEKKKEIEIPEAMYLQTSMPILAVFGSSEVIKLEDDPWTIKAITSNITKRSVRRRALMPKILFWGSRKYIMRPTTM
jgi:hypothetical protein